jgi:RNA polymerase sigma-70 factor (ECF subfamily)
VYTDNSILQQKLSLLYSQNYTWLHAWLRKKMRCEHNSADVAQDTFVRVITSKNALENMREARAFLTSIAKNLLIDRARRQSLEQAYMAHLALSAEDFSSISVPSPEELHQTISILEQVCFVLEGLSDNAQQAFIRHYIEGETQVVIAKDLAVSTKMVQKYLVKALLKCRQLDDFQGQFNE